VRLSFLKITVLVDESTVTAVRIQKVEDYH
jgi:hypothetical protein